MMYVYIWCTCRMYSIRLNTIYDVRVHDIFSRIHSVVFMLESHSSEYAWVYTTQYIMHVYIIYSVIYTQSYSWVSFTRVHTTEYIMYVIVHNICSRIHAWVSLKRIRLSVSVPRSNQIWIGGYRRSTPDTPNPDVGVQCRYSTPNTPNPDLVPCTS